MRQRTFPGVFFIPGLLIFILCGNVSADPALSGSPSSNIWVDYFLENLFKGQNIRLESEDCFQQGDESQGTRHCTRQFSNGNYVNISEDHETLGNVVKRQTVISGLDSEETGINKISVRQRTDFAYTKDGKKMRTKEFFDIVQRPLDGKITRQIMTYEYDLASGLLRKMTSSNYSQINDSQFAALTHYAFLEYDQKGNPLKGRAELWREGLPVAKVFDWNRKIDGPQGFRPEMWNRWEQRLARFAQ